MNGRSIAFAVGASSQLVILGDPVIRRLLHYRQKGRGAEEAGGQLFAAFENEEINVVSVTGPRKGDQRGRTHFRPDRRAEQEEIVMHHSMGLHYVGDWHSHPEERPRPSRTDIASISDCFKRSKHDLAGFLLLIVGQAEPPEGFHLSLHGNKGMVDLGRGVAR